MSYLLSDINDRTKIPTILELHKKNNNITINGKKKLGKKKMKTVTKEEKEKTL